MTQVVYWDDSWLYLSHRFQDPTTGKQFAEGLVRCVMMKDRRRVSPYKIIAEVSNGAVIEVPKEMPNVVKNFLEWDSACSTSMQEAISSPRWKSKRTCHRPSLKSLAFVSGKRFKDL
ncbi:putative HotDog domain superfamily protein [Plasmopara halstedii]